MRKRNKSKAQRFTAAIKLLQQLNNAVIVEVGSWWWVVLVTVGIVDGGGLVLSMEVVGGVNSGLWC